MSVVALKTERLTPAQFAERTTENLDELEGVVVVNVWKDGTFSAGWSALTISTLCMACKVLDLRVTESITPDE